MGSRDEVALWEVTHGYPWLPMGRQLVGLPRWGGEEASCTQRFPMKLEPMRVVVLKYLELSCKMQDIGVSWIKVGREVGNLWDPSSE